MTTTLNSSTFDEAVASNDVVIVDFWAEWCGPCKMFGPIFEETSKSHPDALFVKVDVDESPDLARRFNVMAVPTLAVLKDGKVVHQASGALPKRQLEEVVNAYS